MTPMRDDPISKDFDRHLELMKAAGERTRGILYFFALVFCSTFVVFLEYAFFDWPKESYTKIHKAYSCYLQGNTDSYPEKNTQKSSNPSTPCGEAYGYVHTNYKIDIFKDGTKQLAEEAKTLLSERYKQAMRTVDDIRSTTIPLVGTRFDKNSGILFHNILISCVLGILFLSLQNEVLCLDGITKLAADDEHKKSLILNSHIFAGPKKTVSIWYFLFAPIGFGIVTFVKDIYSFPVSLNFSFYLDLLGPNGWLFPVVELGSTAVVGFFAWKCFLAARVLDDRLSSLPERQPSESPLQNGG